MAAESPIENKILENRIKTDLKAAYNISADKLIPVKGGWLNLKWRTADEKGEVLVKQFSTKRYDAEKLKILEPALQRQIYLKKEGVNCPEIRQCGGRAVRQLDRDTAYMVMEFCGGSTENSDTVTEPQLVSLGSVCGRMHQAFSKLPPETVRGYPTSGRQILHTLWNHFQESLSVLQSPAGNLEEYKKAVLAQKPILGQLTEDGFDRLAKGIAHEDFTSDNILFYRDRVSAVIDFDRNHYSYIWHDIGRAVLCFAFDGEGLIIRKIKAFIEGYSEYYKLTMPDIAAALRLSWCLETPWWIRPDIMRRTQGKVVRFRDEILWLTEHWNELDEILHH